MLQNCNAKKTYFYLCTFFYYYQQLGNSYYSLFISFNDSLTDSIALYFQDVSSSIGILDLFSFFRGAKARLVFLRHLQLHLLRPNGLQETPEISSRVQTPPLSLQSVRPHCPKVGQTGETHSKAWQTDQQNFQAERRTTARSY